MHYIPSILFLPTKVDSRGPKSASPDNICLICIFLNHGDCLTNEILGCKEQDVIQAGLGTPVFLYSALSSVLSCALDLDRERASVDKSCFNHRM